MANKLHFTSKAEAEIIVAKSLEEKEIKERRRKQVRRINELMKSKGLVDVSKDGKRWFYQAAFQRTFGINKSTVHFYYNYERDIPIETLNRISEILGCSLQYLQLKSEAINYEFDTVIQRTGLSENAIENLIHNNYIATHTTKQPGEVSPSELYTDAINYLITKCDAFINIFATAKSAAEHIRESELQYIEPLSIPKNVVAHCSMIYSAGYDKHGERYTINSFIDDLSYHSYRMSDSELRPLTEKEALHLFEHVKNIRLYNPSVWRNACRDQLESIFAAIEGR